MEPLVPALPGGIHVEALARSFGSKAVLANLSFRVEPGEVVGVLGGNGSGKTTLLRILAGLLTPDSGTASVAAASPGRGASGFVPAGDRGVHWRLSGRRNLVFHARLAGTRGVDVDAVCRSAAAQVGAEPFFDLVAGSCSTGQRRRLMVAQALVGRAPVLLLDEPLEDLDAAGIDSMGTVVRGWADAGGSVLLAAPEETRLPHVGRLIELGGEP